MRKAILLLATALLPWSASHPQPGKESTPAPTIKLRTELVPLDVQIIDKTGYRAISDLGQRDPEIYDDGVKQEIEQFSRDKLPLSVVLLLDASGSVWTVLDRLRANALEALQYLKPEDEVAVLVTADETRLVGDFTTEKFVVAETLRELDFKSFGENGILLHDSLGRSASQLLKSARPGTRRVIIAVTDNETIPAHNWRFYQKEQTVSLLLETGVVVCGLVVNHNLPLRTFARLSGLPDRLQGGGDINNYAELTGGEVVSAGSDNVGQKLIELINHLRGRYTLAFAPSNTLRDGKF